MTNLPVLIASYFFFSSGLALGAENKGTEIDSLLAKVGREAVLLSDIERFSDVESVLACAGLLKRESPLPQDRKGLLLSYINEELMYLEARAKKVSTAGRIPLSVQQILSKESCKSKWIALGEYYSKLFRTESRAREGESLLVRELEKRILVDNFRKKEIVPDMDLWRREASLRYPIKVYLE